MFAHDLLRQKFFQCVRQLRNISDASHAFLSQRSIIQYTMINTLLNHDTLSNSENCGCSLKVPCISMNRNFFLRRVAKLSVNKKNRQHQKKS